MLGKEKARVSIGSRFCVISILKLRLALQGYFHARCGVDEFDCLGVEHKSFAAGAVDVVTDDRRNTYPVSIHIYFDG